MFSIRSLSAVGVAAFAAAVIALPVPASATVITAIDTFTITRSPNPTSQLGSYEGRTVFYQDTFSDGAEPTAGGSFFDGSAGTYGVLGSYPSNAESGGKLTLDSSLGGPFVNANGASRTLQRSVLPTDATAGTAAGLKQATHTFSVFGLFDLTIPPVTRDGYGILVNDGGPSGATESVELMVRREENGNLVIRFQEQDFLNGGITTLELDALSIPLGADQIELQIERATLVSNDLTASYRFWDGVNPGSFTVMQNTASFFTNHGWARGGFFAVEGTAAVPEPDTLALLLVSGACLLAATRLPRRASARR